jgi:hypothetical protein
MPQKQGKSFQAQVSWVWIDGHGSNEGKLFKLVPGFGTDVLRNKYGLLTLIPLEPFSTKGGGAVVDYMCGCHAI